MRNAKDQKPKDVLSQEEPLTSAPRVPRYASRSSKYLFNPARHSGTAAPVAARYFSLENTE